MRKILTAIIFFISLSLTGLGQSCGNISYRNDSAIIFSKLNQTNESEIDFGNKINGLQRHYRKIDGKWCLTWVTFWQNRNYVWSCKPDYEDKTNYSILFDSFNSNLDTLNITIPYENGKSWMKIISNGNVIKELTTYYPNGRIKEEFLQNAGAGSYKKFYNNGNLQIHRQGIFRMSVRLIEGDEYKYNESGILIEHEKIN